MDRNEHWIPDHEDGSGWAPVDWGSVIRGARYHYRHVMGDERLTNQRPAYYCVVTRLESDELPPHENTYFVPRGKLADFLAELSLAGGAESIWHVAPCDNPPPELVHTSE
ncbi:MAG: hypothetical protein ACRDJW_16685 [Thermomicrobiales bacterium]